MPKLFALSHGVRETIKTLIGKTNLYRLLQSSVDFVSVAGGFHVENHVPRVQQRGYVEALELAVCDGGYGSVEFLGDRELVHDFDAVFAANGFGVRPRVVDGDVEVVFHQCLVYVDDFGVAHVGAVFLEGKAEDEDVAAEHLDAFLEHELDYAVGHVGAHAVVHAAAGEDDFGVVAVALGALGEVVRVDAYAVAADESGLEGQEVPFGRGGFENVLRVDAHEGEDFRQFVDEGDVDVALRVLYHLGGFGYLDGGSEVRACGDDRRIHFVDEAADFGR